MKSSIKRFLNVSLLLLSMLAALGLHGSSGILASNDASPSIVAAEETLEHAFEAVLDAENAGANVSALIAKLDVAGRNLTEAETDYQDGHIVEADSEAELCSSIASAVAEEALTLKNTALANARSLEWQVSTFSMAGAVVFLVVLASVWIVFKRSYMKKLLGLGPEAGSDVDA